MTQFFSTRTREPLGVKFLPIVERATQKVSLAKKYDAVAGKLIFIVYARTCTSTRFHLAATSLLPKWVHAAVRLVFRIQTIRSARARPECVGCLPIAGTTATTHQTAAVSVMDLVREFAATPQKYVEVSL